MKRILISLALVLGVVFAGSTAPAEAYAPPVTHKTVYQHRITHEGVSARRCRITKWHGRVFHKTCGPWYTIVFKNQW